MFKEDNKQRKWKGQRTIPLNVEVQDDKTCNNSHDARWFHCTSPPLQAAITYLKDVTEEKIQDRHSCQRLLLSAAQFTWLPFSSITPVNKNQIRASKLLLFLFSFFESHGSLVQVRHTRLLLSLLHQILRSFFPQQVLFKNIVNSNWCGFYSAKTRQKR